MITSSLSPSSKRSWDYYFRLLDTELGHMDVREVTPWDIETLVQTATDRAVLRRTGTGSYAGEHMVSVSRYVFTRCVRQGWVDRNVALLVPKPKRPPSTRTALTDMQVNRIYDAAASAYRGYETVIRYFLETGARRGGLLGLGQTDRAGRARAQYLPDLQAVRVLEKGGRTRVLPVGHRLVPHLADERSVLYGMTQRKLETMWGYIHYWSPEAGELGVSSHWLRHTAASRYERATGSYALTAKWLGHTTAGTTGTYLGFSLSDIAHGWHLMTGEEHPLCEH